MIDTANIEAKKTLIWNCGAILTYMGFTDHDDTENVIEIHSTEQKCSYLL